MERDVFLTLNGRRWEEDGVETVTSLSAPAQYFEQDGCRYLFYKEAGEGAGAPVKCRIRLQGNILEVNRKGSVSTRLVFEAGARHRADYATPFGLLSFDICTSCIRSLFGEDVGEIEAAYTLEDGNQLIARCELSIKIHKKGKVLQENSR